MTFCGLAIALPAFRQDSFDFEIRNPEFIREIL